VAPLSEKGLEKALMRAEKLVENMEKTGEKPSSEKFNSFDEITGFMVRSLVAAISQTLTRLKNPKTPKEERSKLGYLLSYETSTLLNVMKFLGEYGTFPKDEMTRQLLKDTKRVALTARRFVAQDRRPVRISLHKV
jgi:hypothetical protein